MDEFSILFVDDDPAIRRVFQDSLPDSQVLLAATPQEARAQLQQSAQQIAIIVVDHYLATYSGVDLLAEVRQQWPEIIRIWTTSASNLDQAIAAINNGGIYSYVMKPWTLKSLRQHMSDAYAAYLQQREEQNQYRKSAVYLLASSLAHEIRTPLASIRLGLTGAEKVYSQLLAGYQTAVEHNLVSHPLQASALPLLQKLHNRCIKETRRISMVIEMMLASAGLQNTQAIALQTESMTETLQEAIEHYPFSDTLGDLVRYKAKHDFDYLGHRSLMVLVIINLLKNADYAIKQQGKGHITITTHRCPDTGHQLIIRDTGVGIATEQLNKIFDDFYTTKPLEHGSGLGLPLCRRVLERFGASIRCHSKLNDYTEFVLCFPLLAGD